MSVSQTSWRHAFRFRTHPILHFHQTLLAVCPQSVQYHASTRYNLRSCVDQRSVTVLSLDHRNHLWRSFTFILQASDLVGSQNTIRSIRRSISQLLLHKLVFGNRVILELLPLLCILSGPCDAVFESTNGAPGNTISG